MGERERIGFGTNGMDDRRNLHATDDRYIGKLGTSHSPRSRTAGLLRTGRRRSYIYNVGIDPMSL